MRVNIPFRNTNARSPSPDSFLKIVTAPKLTAEVYTHVLISNKADELAKLPILAATASPEEEGATKTGTDNLPSLQVTNLMDTSRDTFSLDSDGEIWTYMESGKAENSMNPGMAEKQKAPVSQGKTGAFYSGDHDGTRTRNLQIDSLVL